MPESTPPPGFRCSAAGVRFAAAIPYAQHGMNVVWQEVSEEERSAIVAHAHALVVRDCNERLAGGMTTTLGKPTVEVLGAERAATGLVVTTLSHFRICHYAQSGSDWGEHSIWITETTYASGAVVIAERIVERREIPVPEAEEAAYDDDKVAKSVVEAWSGRR